MPSLCRRVQGTCYLDMNRASLCVKPKEVLYHMCFDWKCTGLLLGRHLLIPRNFNLRCLKSLWDEAKTAAADSWLSRLSSCYGLAGAKLLRHTFHRPSMQTASRVSSDLANLLSLLPCSVQWSSGMPLRFPRGYWKRPIISTRSLG